MKNTKQIYDYDYIAKWLRKQAPRVRYKYAANLVVFTNGSFVHVEHDTIQQPTSKPTGAPQYRSRQQTAYSNTASAARFLTPTRDSLSRSNKKKSLMTQARSGLVQNCRNGKNQTARLRYETNRTSSTAAVVVLSMGAVPNAMGMKVR